ncbi:MAG: leucine-rich repeat domain-containing protein [Clostridiales bacterium]|nr:leucine-rich repeat domain-containing protein [Clostridiales bacterium]
MKKQILGLLLIFAMVFSLAACGKTPPDNPPTEDIKTPIEESFNWPEDASEDSFEFDPETGTISLYVGGGGAVKIPETIGGVTVKALEKSCFYDTEGERDFEDPITAIYIPDSVEKIDTYTFVNNQFLEILRLPAALEEIPRSMCYLCLNLRELTIPDTVKKIGDEAFSTSGLELINLPEGLEKIGDFAFSGCENLVLSPLPKGLKSIGEKAFANCLWIPYYTIPESVTSIGGRAFENTVFALNFPFVYSPSDLPKLDNSGGAVFETVSMILMAWDVSMKQVEDMDKFLLSKGEEDIAWVMFNPEWEDYVDYEAMSCDENGTITAFDHEAGAEGLKVAIPREDKDGTVVITAIGDRAFESRSISFAGLNADIKFIGERAFAGSMIEEISLPISLQQIGEEAFFDCDYLESITLTGEIKEIPARCFQYSDKLKSVILPKTVEKIGDEAFSGCGFKTFVVPEGVKEIGSMAFTGCTQLESIVLPASLERLGDGAFGNCPELKSVTFLGTKPPEMDSMGMVFSSIGMDAVFFLPKTISQADFDSFQAYVSMRGIQAGATWDKSR